MSEQTTSGRSALDPTISGPSTSDPTTVPPISDIAIYCSSTAGVTIDIPRLITQPATNESDIIKCKICFDKDIGIVFIPCGHQMACASCASCLHSCPICRKSIVNCIRTFFA